MEKKQAHSQNTKNTPSSQTKSQSKQKSNFENNKSNVIEIYTYIKVRNSFYVGDKTKTQTEQNQNDKENSLLQKRQKTNEFQKVKHQNFQSVDEIQNEELLFSINEQNKSAEISDFNTNSLYDWNNSIKELLGDPKYAVFSKDDNFLVEPNEREFFEILMAQYQYLPSNQTLHKNEEIKLFIKQVAGFQNDTVKLNELLNKYKKYIVENINKQSLDDIEVLQLQKDALEKYLELQFKKIILKVDQNAEINDESLKETIKSFQSQNDVPIIQVNANNIPVTPQKLKQSKEKDIWNYEKPFVVLNSKQLIKIDLNLNKQIEFYNQKYKVDPFNQFFTSSTTIDITLQEVEQIGRILQDFFYLKSRKSQSLQMLNLPCGNGRLNSVFTDYFKIIDCIDPCEKAIQMVHKQKETANYKRHIGDISTTALQNWSFNQNSKKTYDLIWCNYGFSYLNGTNAIIFLSNASQSLKKDGYLIIKDVLVAEKCSALYFKEEERVFRSYEKFKEDFEKFFKIIYFYEFIPKSQGGCQYRSEGIFILQNFQRKNMHSKMIESKK